ncbi:MAG TPA: hypothetical protein EYN07_06755 [Flavobacteriaceae bacterium]|nr:hypothetical protein [Flavobacteriaceae bacterium]HIN98926.1 hypothetical protein [Flavobacteriaceae bacterium]
MKQSVRILFILSIIVWSGSSMVAQTLLRGAILDKETQQPIANAKFGISEQGIGVTTNEKGRFVYRKYHEVLDENSVFQISAPGYIGLEGTIDLLRKLQNTGGTFYLEPTVAQNVIKLPKTGKISVFWDAAAKGQFRNTDAEIAYLRQYLQNTTATKVTLVVFGEEIIAKQEEFISEETIASFEKLLGTIEYKGISNYDLVRLEAVDEVLLFADEQPVFGIFQPDQFLPVHIVNSNENSRSSDYFKSLARCTSGTYTPLDKEVTKGEQATKDSSINGRFTLGDTPVPYAIISKKGDLKEFFTDAEGYFEVPASEGDILTFYSLGNFPQTLKVSSETTYKVKAVPKAEQLEVVDLNTKRNRSEYAFDSINQRDIVQGRDVPVRSIHKSQFNNNAFSVGEAINGIYGVRSYYDYNRGQTFFTVGGGCARVFIDGHEISADAIPVAVVENISVFDARGSIIPCPSRIIITTRMHPDRIDQRLRKRGYRQLKDNYYREEIPELESIASTTPYFHKKSITGTVKGNGTVLQGASVLRKGTLEEVTTDANGTFSMKAAVGDILEVKHFGMYPKSIVITEETDYVVEMITKAEILDEVELSKTIDKPDTTYDTYDPNRRMEIVHGRKYDVRSVLLKEDLNIAGFDIYETVAMSNSKIIVEEDATTGKKSFFYKRGPQNGSLNIPLATIVDGAALDARNVNPVMVERVSVYISPLFEQGSKIFITTRNHPDIRKKYLAENDIALKNNTYNKKVADIENQKNTYFESERISGVVTVGTIPLAGASILKKGSLNEVITDRDGVFELQATAGDILEIKHAGMFPKTVVINDATEYKIALINKTEILEEVSVNAKKEQQTETVNTAYGDQNKNAVGYKVEDALSKYISSTDISFDQVASKIPGIIVDPNTKQLFYDRSYGGLNKSPIMIVIDGSPVSQNTLQQINPQTITNITSLKGVAATNRYGSQAFGGVLLVETLNKSFKENREKQDLTLQNNVYTETLPTLSFDAIQQDYVDDVASNLSTKIKLEKYRDIRNLYIDKVDFYVDMALYFQQIDAGAAREVRNDFAVLAKDNLKALRILAYLNEHAGEFLQAQKVYERVVTMDPGNPQSYRDLALIYQETGEYNKALELYINMLGDRIPGIDFSNLGSVLSNELQRLINLYKHKINFQRLPNDWLATNFNIDVRMTASWSDTNAPFEFQFVNPKKRFYNWNSDAQTEESKDAQKSTEEFLIDDAAPGKWLINVRYTGDENATNIPPYLKYTVYKDFGTSKETRTIKLVKLESQIQKVTLDSFVY